MLMLLSASGCPELPGEAGRWASQSDQSSPVAPCRRIISEKSPAQKSLSAVLHAAGTMPQILPLYSSGMRCKPERPLPNLACPEHT